MNEHNQVKNAEGCPQPDTTIPLFVGGIVSPSEIKVAMHGVPDLPPDFGKCWTFVGYAEPEVIAAFKKAAKEPVRQHVLRFRTGSGGVYCVVAHQVPGYEHRLLLPLFEPAVARCASALKRQGYTFFLGTPDASAVVTVNGAKNYDLFGWDADTCKPVTGEHARPLVQEMPAVALEMLRPDAVPGDSAAGPSPRINVSFVMPSTAIGELQGFSQQLSAYPTGLH